MGRIVQALTGVVRFAEDHGPGIIKAGVKAGSKVGKFVGDGAVSGIKKALKGGAAGTGKFHEFLKNGGPDKIKGGLGKFGGYAARDIDDTIRGANNILGKYTGGKEIKSWNKLRNKMLDTDKYTGAKSFKILRDADDSIILGKRFTKGAMGTIRVGAGVMGMAEGTGRKIRERSGVMTGVAGNAPVNNYAYQGASYADNAGATGDIVLNMHANRGSRTF